MSDFEQQLDSYKRAIDADIKAYSGHVRRTTREQYGPYAEVVTDAFLDMLGRGGKRIRGMLVMVGYEMCGGTDREMVVRAATALEMLHAYLLIIDDIQDRSALRRGKPTVHELLASYHRKHGLKGDAAHAGVSLALNAAFSGTHAAQALLAGLNVDAELKLKVLGIVNYTMVTTAHGQTQDLINEMQPQADSANIERVMEWKTAHYTVLNPLCVGMVLAGAGCEDTDAIRDYALHAGMAFQITDDIIGVFGDDKQTGKSAMDDIREGKRTLLTQYTLEHAPKPDSVFLQSMLGNSGIAKDGFDRCRAIIRESGAFAHAEAAAENHANKALAALKNAPAHWQAGKVDFLRRLTKLLVKRSS